MRGRGIRGGVCALVLLGGGTAQEPVFDELPLRVVAAESGDRFTIDRGSFDRVEVGDRVVLHPRDGRSYYASILSVTERGAVIELVNTGAPVVPGTKGVVLVPVRRRARAGEPRPGEPRSGEPEAVPVEPGPDQPRRLEPLPELRAGAGDDSWRPGMPLLGNAYAQKPEQRAARVTGRAWLAVDLTYTLDTFTHSFFRSGTDLEVENLFGGGETLRFSGEIAYLTEQFQNTDSDLRVYELSYAAGGTRFAPLRWQLGRFRQEGLPELGILDGLELIHRFDNGIRVGGSIGYMPELDDDMESLADLQIAAFVRWSPDFNEYLALTGGVQKTWHRGNSDRDLIVARVDYLPPEGLEIHGNVWLDVYGGDDQLKNESVGLTRAHAFVGHRFGTKSGFHLAWNHEEYPETLRQEFTPPVLDANIADAHKDHFALQAFTGEDDVRWRLRSTIWFDEETTGGSFEVGREVTGWLAAGDRFELSALATKAAYTKQAGVRIGYGRSTPTGRWDAFYELMFVHWDNFPSDRDDMLQHRVRGQWTQPVGERLDLMLYSDFGFWDDATTIALGCYLQRNF